MSHGGPATVNTSFRTPARRWSAVAAAAVLAALSGTGSTAAHATEGDPGSASAAVLRTGLDVSLLNRTVHAPLTVSLNEVSAPQSARETALTATLDGVDGGKPFSVLRAEAADAASTVRDGRAEASAHLAAARLHVPGLPLLSVVELETVSSKAVCVAGETPKASVTLPAAVTVLGKRVRLTSGGPTDVEVPGVGSVRLNLSGTKTTSGSAAATALRLDVSVNPLKLNVAEVEGTVTVAEARCSAPAVAAGAEPQGVRAEADLAETGSSSTTPYVAAGAVALLAAGGGAVALARRRVG
ncbi:SCO1860 family LAETG-anchored protein [Streptomyces edwardsiae]|uniref:SCO1860 family LAETG-anchored protein n=1 Tax=Streptomyces edwardsiae TaxID=3075527 RepID=UPI0038738AB7